MLHIHITSWVLAIIFFFATYFNFSAREGATPFYKIAHILLRISMVLVLVSGIWSFIQEMSAHHGGGHLLLTCKMVCGLIVIALMEVTIAKRKKGEPSHAQLWWTIIMIIITMVLGVILPWGPISSLFGIH
ncbi:YisL family protein [Staphylococcus sp. SQ8-PEA]|uniref:UPF0344 protein N9R04_04455 n=1 Tax=Staphylococcus marylandisciuri TaxID=2981529 RepID=A0ABT2QPS1_9STAP|nr:YisL family protein [Staphylococcus marylandisciuri]MCU5745972.1 YisL family protein [Staphylococcus marylandisciuri]